MAQRIVDNEQYEAVVIRGNLDGSAMDVEGEVGVEGMQGSFAFTIAPNDDTDLSAITNALYVGFTGNISLVCSGDTVPVTFFNVPGGSFLPLQVRKVRATLTTASGIVGVI